MENLKEVDWSKAPDGATHYNKDCCCPWLKETPASYFVENKGVWKEYSTKLINYKDHFDEAVKRPQEWDDSGIPPVGTECEYRLNDGTWFKCKITYVLSEQDCFIAWCDHLNMEQYLTFSSNKYKLQLRKIKTPEQIAEEERLQVIEDMYVTVMSGASIRLGVESLYDAGYRKSEEKCDE